MAGQKTIPFPAYAPDLTTLGMPASSLISGAVPRADGYGPFKSFQEFTSMLPGDCRGYFFARRSDGSVAIFAGTVNELYLLDNSTFAWGLVSKGGGPYSGLTTGANWRFAQFNDLVIAVQRGDPPQKYNLASGGTFVDLGGSPPQAAHIAVINGFLVLTGLLSSPRRIQWSDLFAPEVWTAGVGLSDFQDLPDGGNVHGITGGDYFGMVFQDEPIRRITYVPGSPVVFQITKVIDQDPLFAEYSVVQASDRAFYLSGQGFKMVQAGGSPVPIGKEFVDRFFFGDVDAANLQLVIASADPSVTRAYWAYKSKAGAAGLFDKVLCYDWSIKDRPWSILPISGFFLAALAKPGLTLEQLDAIAPTPLIVLGAADNGSGKVRLTLNALSNSDFSLGSVADGPSQNNCTVYGIVGTVEANVTTKYVIVDATHIDLPNVAFSNAYVSGGNIGGSLDKLPFSLDSISSAAIAALSMVGTNGRVGFFNGENMEAILETGEVDLEGSTVFVEAVRPMTDCADVVASIGGRFRAQDAVAYTGENGLEDDGVCPIEVETRYARARLRMPAGSIWTYASGIQPLAQEAGEV